MLDLTGIAGEESQKALLPACLQDMLATTFDGQDYSTGAVKERHAHRHTHIPLKRKIEKGSESRSHTVDDIDLVKVHGVHHLPTKKQVHKDNLQGSFDGIHHKSKYALFSY